MTDARRTQFRSTGGLRQVPMVVWALLVLCLLSELVLSGADLGLWGDRNWRLLAY